MYNPRVIPAQQDKLTAQYILYIKYESRAPETRELRTRSTFEDECAINDNM